MNMDRFSTERDSQDEAAYYVCDQSKENIYTGERYLLTSEGSILKDDFNVLINHYNVLRKYAGEEIV
jgi:N-acyl-L-homoserine lactone synthetase